MVELYRFRSIDQLLDKYHELESQTIYFAKPSELNDPIEGIRDVYWHGDEIVWINQFRNYISSLFMTYHTGLLFGEEQSLPRDHIPFRGLADQLKSAPITEHIENAIARIFEICNLHEFINRLVESNIKVRREELIIYFYSLHSISLYEIETIFINSNILDEGRRSVLQCPSIPELYANAVFFDQDGSDSASQQREFIMRFWGHAFASRVTIQSYNTALRTGRSQGENWTLIFRDFPRTYVDALEKIIYPQWYAASFATSCANSSMWAHYADAHRGACLVFELQSSDDMQGIFLSEPADPETGVTRNSSFYEIRDITYKPKPEEFDFFRSIGWLPRPSLLELWYTDEEGNLSDTGSHLGADGDIDCWRDRFWMDFYRDITVKTNDWSYENEKRLILFSILDDLLDKRNRILKYDIKTLKGVVFGIKTSEFDKQRIMDVLRNICIANDGIEFELHQAFYEPESGDIQTMPM